MIADHAPAPLLIELGELSSLQDRHETASTQAASHEFLRHGEGDAVAALRFRVMRAIGPVVLLSRVVSGVHGRADRL